MFELRHDKNDCLHMQKQRRRSAVQLISAYVFATKIVQSLFFLKEQLSVNGKRMCTKNVPLGSLLRNSVIRITDRPDMTSAVYGGRKALNELNKPL